MNRIEITTLTTVRLLKSPDDLFISIPAKLAAAVRHINPNLLKAVHKNEATAKEICLHFCSFLNASYFNDEITRVQRHSDELLELYGSTYPAIRTALESGTEQKGPIIKCDHHYAIGFKAMSYWYADTYRANRCGNYLVSYKLKSKRVQEIHSHFLYERMIASLTDPIIANLYKVYPMVELPSEAFLLAKGKKLAADGETSKKGKKYKMCNRNRSRFSEEELKTISFIEDGIKRFRALTQNGFLQPRSQGDAAGGRITDTFTLMNSWTREVKINGMIAVECDFKCLHPNIAVSVHEGSLKFITHKKVAEEIGINTENSDVMAKFKTEHLAFFNKEVVPWSMLLSQFYSCVFGRFDP